VPVGTVDELQGREARVVFCSMATSSAESVPRTLDFLFSRGSSQGRRNRAGPGRDLHDTAVPAVLHHDPARVARQALGRFRGNAHAVLQDGLARRVGIREHGRRFRGNVTQVGEGPASRLCS
jgi:hypothetical protein